MRCSSIIVAISGLMSSASAMAVDSSSNDIAAMLDMRTLSGNSVQDPCDLAESPSVNASIQLSSWLECQVNGFYPFPANSDWPTGHATAFSKDIKFSFNGSRYNFDGSLALYHSFNATLAKSFEKFGHGFTNTLSVPNDNGDKGGYVFAIGWAGGLHRALQRNFFYTNGAFAVVKDVDGKRKIVEFREAGNIMNTAPMPPTNDWTCAFP